MKNHYTPHPIDTSGVTLSPELVKLANLLSANVHDVWGGCPHPGGLDLWPGKG